MVSEKNTDIEKLTIRNTSLEVENMDLADKLSQYTSRVLLETCSQTETPAFNDTHTQTCESTEPTAAAAAKQASTSKLNEMTGHVANIAAIFNGKSVTSPVATVINASDHIDSAGLQNELKSVKHKNDHLILEKTGLKARNDELKQENEDLRFKLDEVTRESEELATYITTSIEKNEQLIQKSILSPPPAADNVRHFCKIIKVFLEKYV